MDDDELRAQQKKRKESTIWMLTFLIWVIGAGLLLWLWELQKLIPGFIGETLAFVLYVVAFFYVFALIRIHEWLWDRLRDD
jgi:hypothetical protein